MRNNLSTWPSGVQSYIYISCLQLQAADSLTGVPSMLEMFISLTPRILEVGGYHGSPTALQLSLTCSLLGGYCRSVGVPHL